MKNVIMKFSPIFIAILDSQLLYVKKNRMNIYLIVTLSAVFIFSSGCASRSYIHKYEACVPSDIAIKFKDGSEIYSIHLTQDDGNSFNFTRFPTNEYYVCVGKLCDRDSWLFTPFRINLMNKPFFFTGKVIRQEVDMPVTFGTSHGDVYYQVLMTDATNTLHPFWISIHDFDEYYMDTKYLEELRHVVREPYKFQCVNPDARYVGTYSLWQMFSYGMKEPLKW